MDTATASRISRRAFLAATAGAVTLGGLPAEVRAQGAFNWKRHAGTTLRLVANRVPPGELLLKRLPEFEALTGIKVTAEVLPEEQFFQKIVVELTSGASSIDLFMTLIGQDGAKYLKAGWYEPLKRFVDDPTLTDPNWNPGDITKAAWESQTVFGTLIGVPIEVGTHGLMSNKPLLQQAGVESPKTMSDLETAARKLTRREAGVFGIAMRGKRGGAVGIFSNFLHSLGGQWLDRGGDPALTSPEAIAAFELYGRLLRESGPPGSANNHFTEVNSLFMTGRAALIVEASVFATFYEDPSKSRVTGQVGYHPIPAGPGGSRPVVNGWASRCTLAARRRTRPGSSCSGPPAGTSTWGWPSRARGAPGPRCGPILSSRARPGRRPSGRPCSSTTSGSGRPSSRRR
jgi:multiple sugar transport system substrate-binding protein